mgnify:CR=1 FL=1
MLCPRAPAGINVEMTSFCVIAGSAQRMSEQATEPQAKPEGGAVLNLCVKDQSGNEVHFKVKPTTKLEKVR